MKEQAQIPQNLFMRVAAMSLILIVSLLFTFSAFSQESRIASHGGDPISMYLDKNKDSQTVKLYQKNPDDLILKRAIRMLAILENPQMFPEFNSADLDRMRTRLKVAESELSQIHIYMQKGDSFEVAKARNERYQNTESKSGSSLSESNEPKMYINSSNK